MRRERLLYFDYFRGISILLVVAGHCYYKWEITTFPEIFFTNLITGATAIFVFVSGFFFHFAFYNNFNFMKFMKSKTINVALPYLILSVTTLLAIFLLVGRLYFTIEISSDPVIQNVFAFFAKIATGRVWTPYWYVPFIMLMFLLSPLFVSFIQVSIKSQIYIVLVLLLVSSVSHRPTSNINPIHSVIYLASFYCLGIIFSELRDRILPVVRRTAWLWIGLMLLFSAISAWVGQVGNMHKMTPWQWAGFDLMVPLKLFTIPAMLGICLFLERWDIRSLKFFANISFGLFFIHSIVGAGIKKSDIFGIPDGALGSVILFIADVAISVLIILLIKRSLGRRSRHFIGC